MANLRLYFVNKKIGSTFERSTLRQRDRVLASMRGTLREARDEFLKRGRADIRKASRAFARSDRWAPGLSAEVSEGGGTMRMTIRHIVSYFKVFTKTTTIHGNPLLWIPLSFAKDAIGIRARDYPGPLFRVDRAGKAPLLMTSVGGEAEAKYFGKESVTIPQKFHTFEIARDIARRFKQTYRRQFRQNG